MKFIILSDIHGNARALKECMNVIENMEFDAIIWCGDYITDFPESHKVIELIQFYSQKYKSYIISGNREKNIIDFINGKEINIRQRKNLEYTYKSLTNADIEWIKSLPEELEIILDDNNKIYISHKCTYKNIDKCKYKIFGHTHKQYNFIRESIKYINPGSVGITTDEVVGAQFSILEITDRFDKIDEVIVKYDITSILEAIKEPRKIDMDLVKSQETRRMLDRIIGFKLSKLLQNKIQSKSSDKEVGEILNHIRHELNCLV